MGFILRLLRMGFPIFLFYVLGKFLNFYVAVFRYNTQSRNRTEDTSKSRDYRRSGGYERPEERQNRTYQDPYEVLNCSKSSTDEEIKKSYRDLAAKYHPDRFMGMSLDDDFVKLASEKFQEIQSAYDEIRRMRGI